MSKILKMDETISNVKVINFTGLELENVQLILPIIKLEIHEPLTSDFFGWQINSVRKIRPVRGSRIKAINSSYGN